MGMTSSEEYVRTSRQVVFKIQRAVNRALVIGLELEYREDEAIQRLCDAAEKNGANPNRIKKRHSVMAGWSGRHCLGGVYPTLVVNDDDWQDQAGDDAELELAVQVAAYQVFHHSFQTQLFETSAPQWMLCETR